MADEAVLRPYEPTWRDKLAQLLLGDGRASPEKNRLIEGLVGSRGLGSTGGSVSDFTPLGMLLAKSDMDKAGNEGDTLGVISSAMAFMPGAKPAAQLAARAAESAAPKGIRAYHGSPHDFDAFDLSKIGTGEGAQAYGHGLYFAENQDVAKGYRDALTKANPGTPEYVAQRALQQHPDQESAIAALRQPIVTRPDGRQKFSDVNTQAADLLAQNTPVRGRMYEVNINAAPEHFLDWDKPLSEQSPVVRDAVNRVGRKPEPYGLDRVADDMRPVEMKSLLNTPEGIAALNQHGVPGIKYLDQGSRSAGDGSRNYVVFDPSMIEIMRKYGLGALTFGGLGGLGGISQGDDSQTDNTNQYAQ